MLAKQPHCMKKINKKCVDYILKMVIFVETAVASKSLIGTQQTRDKHSRIDAKGTEYNIDYLPFF